MRSGRQWPLRLVGSVFGLSAGLVGLLTLLGADGQPDLERERAVGFGVAALVIGVVALVGSLAARDVHALWYCAPRRWRAFRGDMLTPADDANEVRRNVQSRDRS